MPRKIKKPIKDPEKQKENWNRVEKLRKQAAIEDKFTLKDLTILFQLQLSNILQKPVSRTVTLEVIKTLLNTIFDTAQNELVSLSGYFTATPVDSSSGKWPKNIRIRLSLSARALINNQLKENPSGKFTLNPHMEKTIQDLIDAENKQIEEMRKRALRSYNKQLKWFKKNRTSFNELDDIKHL